MQTEEVWAALWAALPAIGKKELKRQHLKVGEPYKLDLAIKATVNEEPLEQHLQATVLLNADGVRTSSTGPDATQLVANLLALVNEATREKQLRELPERFAANEGALPVVEGELLEQAQHMLKRLRAKSTQRVSGSVTCTYTYGHPTP